MGAGSKRYRKFRSSLLSPPPLHPYPMIKKITRQIINRMNSEQLFSHMFTSVNPWHCFNRIQFLCLTCTCIVLNHKYTIREVTQLCTQWFCSIVRFPLATEEELIKNNDDCAICWDSMSSARKLTCGHLFHKYDKDSCVFTFRMKSIFKITYQWCCIIL